MTTRSARASTAPTCRRRSAGRASTARRSSSSSRRRTTGRAFRLRQGHGEVQGDGVRVRAGHRRDPVPARPFLADAMLSNIFAKAAGAADIEPPASPRNDPGQWEFFLSHHQARAGIRCRRCPSASTRGGDLVRQRHAGQERERDGGGRQALQVLRPLPQRRAGGRCRRPPAKPAQRTQADGRSRRSPIWAWTTSSTSRTGDGSGQARAESLQLAVTMRCGPVQDVPQTPRRWSACSRPTRRRSSRSARRRTRSWRWRKPSRRSRSSSRWSTRTSLPTR